MVLCLQEALEVPEVMRCVLLCMLEAVEGGLCLLEALEVPEVIRCLLLCMLEVAENGLISIAAIFSLQCDREHKLR